MESKEKVILVTGGAGFVGSHLVDLLAHDNKVRILDDFSSGGRENLQRSSGRIDVVAGDVRDSRLVADCLRGVDVVFHLACRGVRHSIGNPRENFDVNANGTLVLLEEARQAKVLRFVHVSSSEVYGTARRAPMDEEHPCFPETVYGAGKLAGEAAARAYFRTHGLHTTVVRPFNNFGPRSHHEGDSGEVIPRFAVWALNDRQPVIFGDGLQTRDFLYVEDTAFWLRRAAECDDLIGETVNFGSGQETSVNELAAIVWEKAGRGRPTPNHQPPRPGDVRRHVAGIERARRLLGFQVRTSLPDGIGKVLDHFRTKDSAGLLAETPAVNWGSSER